MKGYLVNTIPIRVPDFIILDLPRNVHGERPKVALSGLSPDELSELCDEFRAGVFEKAGTRDPHPPAQTQESEE